MPRSLPKPARLADEVVRPEKTMTPPPRRRRSWSLAVLGVAALVLVAGWYARTSATAENALSQITTPIGKGSVVSAISASGNVRPVSIVRVSTLQGGTLASIPVDFNADVHKGDLLAQIEDATQQSALRSALADVATAAAQVRSADAMINQRAAEGRAARAEARTALALVGISRSDLALADAALARQRSLLKSGAVSVAGTEQAEATAASAAGRLQQAESQADHAAALVEAADAAVLAAQAQKVATAAAAEQALAHEQRARIDLERTRIRSPVDGTIVWKSVDVGQTVSTNVDPPVLFFIAQDLTEVQVETTIDESDISHVRTGQTVSFTVAAYPGERFEGRVRQIRTGSEALFGAKQDGGSAVTYIVEIATANKDRRLLPGMTASVRIITAEATDQLTVPAAALRYGEDFVAAHHLGFPVRPGLRPLLLVNPSREPRVIAVRTLASDGVMTAVRTGSAWSTSDRAVLAERPDHDR